MPIVNVVVSTRPSVTLSQAINSLILDHTATILHKDPRLTAVVIHYVNPVDWWVAGKNLAEHQRHSVFLEIKITDETNTKSEKAAYIAAVFKSFTELLGPLHEKSYVHVQDVRAAAYGYGGQTQEARFQHQGLNRIPNA